MCLLCIFYIPNTCKLTKNIISQSLYNVYYLPVYMILLFTQLIIYIFYIYSQFGSQLILHNKYKYKLDSYPPR